MITSFAHQLTLILCFYVVCLSFAMITYLVGTDVVAQMHLQRMRSHILGLWKVSMGVVVSEWFVLRNIIDF